ncbi:hypothetical protein D3C84_581770 [compost metagenome]
MTITEGQQTRLVLSKAQALLSTVLVVETFVMVNRELLNQVSPRRHHLIQHPFGVWQDFVVYDWPLVRIAIHVTTPQQHLFL